MSLTSMNEVEDELAEALDNGYVTDEEIASALNLKKRGVRRDESLPELRKGSAGSGVEPLAREQAPHLTHLSHLSHQAHY
jgi:hypothetical protein